MPDAAAPIAAYVAALTDPDEGHLAALGDALAADVVVLGMFGPGTGLDDVRSSIATSPRLAMLKGASWSAPELDGSTATARATFAPGGPLGGVVLHVAINDAGAIMRVEQEMVPAPRPATTPLALTDEVNAAVAGAFDNGTTMMLAYVDAGGEPHLSLRGTTQPFSPTQLAIWVRDRGGGFLAALPGHPHVALFYRDPATRATYQFAGRAHVEEDPGVRDRVYRSSPEPERNLDARCLGAAVVVDLDRVEGSGPSGRFRMERSA
jgi:hypothetical protein